MTEETAFLPAIPAGVRPLDRLAARLVLARLLRWSTGRITLTLPDGSSVAFGPPAAASRVSLHVREWRFFRRVLAGADIGFGEAYVDGDVEVSDLAELCRLFLLDPSMVETRPLWRLAGRLRNAGIRTAHRNTRAGSRRNVRRHYDLSNDLYRLFLDDSLTYSCATFGGEDLSLEEAQRRKVDGICRALDLRPEHRLLEIGSGWGTLAIHAARAYGARVLSVTLSEEQHALARERVRAAGVEDRVEIALRDYREVGGEFDRVVSVEMFEAVGYEYFGKFFAACAARLRPTGRMLLQTITFSDQDFDRYRKDLDWIRKHVFPGGLLPSLYELARQVKEHTDLRITAVRDIGVDYATTLAIWRERFSGRLPEVRALGFDDRFVRTWELYLASCEAAFRTRYLGTLQLELERPFAAAVARARSS